MEGGKGLFIFGLGFLGTRLANRVAAEGGWRVGGSIRQSSSAEDEKAEISEQVEVVALPFEEEEEDRSEKLEQILRRYDHFLFTAPVDRASGSDPFLKEAYINQVLVKLAEEGCVTWAGYLSTTSVYGSHEGAWVDEETPLMPTLKRGEMRLKVEQEFLFNTGLPMHIFRLPGIYGPGRGTIARLRKGSARCIVKEGQVFSRIHVDDIVGVLLASMADPNPGRAYNVVDDEPEMNHIVTEFACELMGIPAPPREDYEQVKETMSFMSRSFFSESKRVSNKRIKEELGYTLLYPTYREGMRAQLEEELANGWTIIDPSVAVDSATTAPNSPTEGKGSSSTRASPLTPRRGTKRPLTGRTVPGKLSKMKNALVALWRLFWRPLGHFTRVGSAALLDFVHYFFVNPLRQALRRFSMKEESPTVLLVDNGSLRAEPFRQLRSHAENLEAAILNDPGLQKTFWMGTKVIPISARFSDRIPTEKLDGKPGHSLAKLVDGVDGALDPVAAARSLGVSSISTGRIITLPYFLGPSATITDFVPSLLKRAFPQGKFVSASPLVSRDYQIAEILVDMVKTVAEEKQLQVPYAVVLVDHGSPSRTVNRVRRGLAAQMRRMLGRHARCVVDCSMERREGPKYAFNDPLLENVFDKGGLGEGDVVLAMAFLAPGRHAGEGGDIAEILDAVCAKKQVRVHQTGLIGDVDRNGERMVALLKERTLQALL